MSELAEILFRCLNSFILFALFVYAARRFLIPFIRSQIAHDIIQSSEHTAHLVTLSEKQRTLQSQLEADISEWDTLKQRIIYWNSLVEQTKQVHIDAQKRYIHQLQERKITIKKYSISMEKEQKIGTVAVQHAKEQLMTFFSDQKQGEKYIFTILKHIVEK